ncbi:hypothetical protein [Candidatus Electronema sp. PJ]|uniref:hypothetical protein n=1 Tax=Candidatus Electronema sp. PJ TaxID=3401572 RepID=UPI003AA8A0A2
MQARGLAAALIAATRVRESATAGCDAGRKMVDRRSDPLYDAQQVGWASYLNQLN